MSKFSYETGYERKQLYDICAVIPALVLFVRGARVRASSERGRETKKERKDARAFSLVCEDSKAVELFRPLPHLHTTDWQRAEHPVYLTSLFGLETSG